MALDVYWIALLALAPTSILLAGRGYFVRPLRRLVGGKRDQDGDVERCEESGKDRNDMARRFRITFLRVYLLVMGSEWLQVST